MTNKFNVGDRVKITNPKSAYFLHAGVILLANTHSNYNGRYVRVLMDGYAFGVWFLPENLTQVISNKLAQRRNEDKKVLSSHRST